MSIDPPSAMAARKQTLKSHSGLKIRLGIPVCIHAMPAILACIQIEFIPKMHGKFLYSGVTGAPIMTTIRVNGVSRVFLKLLAWGIRL
jgi:hypothetical protein